MSTKQCDCCDLYHDNEFMATMASATPGARYLICEDCEDSCPLDNICNISGRAIKPDVEQALIKNGGAGNGPASQNGGGFGTTGTHHIDGSLCDYPTLGTCAHPTHTAAGAPQSVAHLLQQIGGTTGARAQVQAQLAQMGLPQPTPPCSLCQHEKAACGCSCSDCSCGCVSCAGSGIAHYGLPEQDGTPCSDCDGSGASRKPKPPPKFLTKEQGVTFDSTLERMKLQLKAGLNDEGRPLKDRERKDLERQIQIREPSEEDEARELLEPELGTYDQEIRALLGVED